MGYQMEKSMKSYHLTQEQALEIAKLKGVEQMFSDDVYLATASEITAFVNTALDQVFGEQWISVEDRLPPDETPVLARYRQTEYIVAELRWEHPSFEDTYKAFRYWDSPYNDGQVWEWQDVTHWMPLPSAPKELS